MEKNSPAQISNWVTDVMHGGVIANGRVMSGNIHLSRALAHLAQAYDAFAQITNKTSESV